MTFLPNVIARESDIVQIVLDNFVVDEVYTESVEGLGILRVFVPGINKHTQLAIHDFLTERLPAGIRLDVRAEEPPSSICAATPVRNPIEVLKRDPKWK